MMHMRSRTVMLFTLLTLLVVSGYMNYRAGKQQTQTSANLPVVRIVSDVPVVTPSAQATAQPTSGIETFADAAAQRNQMREEELAMLDEMIKDPKGDTEILSQAQKQKLALLQRMEIEKTLETLIASGCGFSGVIAYVNGSSVTILVEAQTLSEQQLTQILDFAIQETGQSAENIKILARK